MANKKSKKKAPKTRRRGRGRVGAAGGGVPLEMMAFALGGGLGGRIITNVTKNVGFIQKRPIFRVGLKGLICYWMLTQKSSSMMAAGFGLAGETALDAAGQFAPNVFGLAAQKSAVGATVIDLDNPISGANEDYGVAGMNDDLAVAGAY